MPPIICTELCLRGAIWCLQNTRGRSINGVKDSYLVGAQASLGAEYIFGELPRIGGEWGFGVIGKYSYIRGTKQPVEPFADMDYEVIDSSDVGWYWDVDQTEITPNLSNFNVSGTLVWHY